MRLLYVIIDKLVSHRAYLPGILYSFAALDFNRDKMTFKIFAATQGALFSVCMHETSDLFNKRQTSLVLSEVIMGI